MSRWGYFSKVLRWSKSTPARALRLVTTGATASPFCRPGRHVLSTLYIRGRDESCCPPDSCSVLPATQLVFKAWLPKQTVNSKSGWIAHLILLLRPRQEDWGVKHTMAAWWKGLFSNNWASTMKKPWQGQHEDKPQAGFLEACGFRGRASQGHHWWGWKVN